MLRQKVLNSTMSILMIMSLLFGAVVPASAQQGSNPIAPSSTSSMPVGPTDESKVPHYFGPYPNWANSPFTLPNAAVSIQGDGSGASAVAQVDPVTQGISSIQITSPGSGYTYANVFVSGGNNDAAATATVNLSGVVTSVNVDLAGGGYSSPQVSFSGGGATTGATGTAYGGVDAVNIVDGGFGYSMPTVDFDLPDAPEGVMAKAHAEMDVNGTITAVVVDDPGSGYLNAPGVAIHNGTLFDPIAGATPATTASTLKITSVTVDTFGSGYTSVPAVQFSDLTGTGAGASATAFVDVGGVTSISVTNPGTGYLNVGMRKFVDDLPGMCLPPSCPSYTTNPTAKYIPLAVPEAKIYNGIEADEYEIAVVQYRTSFSSDLPPTLVRGYVQLETPANAGISQHYPLENELLNGTKVSTGYFAVTPPQWLGPIISATKNKPVRIIFRNLLPTGSDGDLFLPADSTLMGSGMGPMTMMEPMNQGSVMDDVRNPPCTEYPKGMNCFKDNRATLHLHGGITPWISDGTAHQWITPAGEMTAWPQGVSVSEVPDMSGCAANDDGCQTFYYTNQQSARLLFYHDHSWGITRLNVYAGEAAGYLISDAAEQTLLASGAIPADQIPLIIQDRTFVPDAAQLALQDPTWDVARWGSKGSFWYHHVYMPAQNPGDPSGMSAYGRWMYGPWFWPPAADTKYGPINNPYYDPNCNLDDPATWQYQTDPFCEPQKIPGTPNISVGMEQFNDTPVVNGVAYPKVSLQPKSYRLRILNAANDRFWNLQWYVADPTQGNGLTEVALKAAELEAAQTDPNAFPTPDTTISLPGPDWIQIGSEGGFLPAPVVIDGQQPTTWITDPTRFDVGNVDKHSLLLAPAERADVIVDFSKFAGKTLILYNDAPAAFPARVASYDYYTGAPDLSPVGAPTILPGYGPNTRTIMQVTIAGTAAPAFNLTKLRNAFRHTASGTGIFESGQHPIIVGQAGYNSAYGTSFAASSNCNAPGSGVQRCDGFVRVGDTLNFGFNTLRAPSVKLMLPLQPKAIHDEMNATTFDEFGRMQANLGVEAQPPTPGQQNVTLYPFVNPATELIDATNLPKAHVVYDGNGLPVSDVKISAIANSTDGTQIWRITHNGVDTHPIHFHLYDVQVVNRVTWDNIIIPPDANELGWKDTVRISPLEDTIVALRPIIPEVPFELPNAIRLLNPMMPAGSQAMFHNFDPQGNPTTAITNQLVNFGWEYVYHCHILSHEEMDMMRPVSVALPPNKPTGLTFDNGTLTWDDNSITETSFVVQRAVLGNNWIDLATIQSPLDQPNIHQSRTYTDATYVSGNAYRYRIVARNTVGFGGQFPSLNADSFSDPVNVGSGTPPVVVSSVRQNPTPSNLATVNFLVTFSDAVSGVDAGDFSLTASGGIAGASVTGVTPADGTGLAYNVAVDTGTGDGTIRLDVLDNDTILNTGWSLPLGGTGLGNGNFTTGESYDLDKTPPAVVSILRSSPNPSGTGTVWFTVNFSEPITGLDPADFALSLTGSLAGASITSVTGTGALRSVSVNVTSGTGTLALNLMDNNTIIDAASNPLGGAGTQNFTTGEIYDIYQTVPLVVSIVRASPDPTSATTVDYTVTFSEAVTGVNTSDFALTLTGAINGASVTSVTDLGTGISYTVTVNTGNASGTLRLDLMDNDSIRNAMSLPLGGIGSQNYLGGEVYTIDKVAPAVVSILRASPNPTNAASVDYTVTFSKAVTGVDTTDFVPTVTGSILGASVVSVVDPSATGLSFTVTVNTGAGSGTLRLDLIDNDTIVDNVNNPLGGLGVQNYTAGDIYDIDKTPPTVASILRAGPNPTNAASLDYTVTFSEPVTGVDAADFVLTLSGAVAGASITGVTGSGTSYTVTVDSGTGDGTIRLDMPASAIIADLVGNPLTGLPITSGDLYDIDKTVPTAVSILRASVDPSNAASVDYTVTFSEPVTGVDATDFAFTLSGLSGAAVANVAGSGTTYTITVDTGTGDGTLRLDLMDNDSIIDAATNPLGGAGAQNFTTGDTYSVDKTPPIVVSILRVAANPTNLASVDYTVTLSEPVTGVDATDFALTATGAVTGASVTNVAGSGTTYTVTINTGTGDGTLRLDLMDDDSIIDVANNPLGGAGVQSYTGAEIYDIDKTPPAVVSIIRAAASPTNAASLDYTVTFSEAVTGVDASDFALTVTGLTGTSLTAVSGSGTTYTVSVNSGAGQGTLQLDLMDNDSIIDAATNPLGGAGAQNFTTGEVYSVDHIAPTVVSVARASTSQVGAANVDYTVTFSEPVTGVDAADFTPTTTGAITGATITNVVGSGAVYTVSVNTGMNAGTLRLDVPASASVADLVGNPLAGLPVTNGEVYTMMQVVSAGMYEDTDAAWMYYGNWLSYSGSGPTNNTSRYTTAGNYTEIAINGVKFMLTYVKASNRGLIDVYVDGVKIDTINASGATLAWQQNWSSPTLSQGVHIIRFAHAGGGTYIDVDAIRVFDPPPGVGIYDDTHPAWVYNGSWTAFSGAGPYNNTNHYTGVRGNDAQFTFDGAKFALTYVKATNRGLIDVYVDGTKIGQINARGTTLAWQQVWTSPTFAAGIHTVRFVHAGGGTYIDIDAIQVLPPPPPVGAGIYDDPNVNWAYSGTWTTYNGAGPYNNTDSYSSVVGSEAQITFTGTGFSFTYVKASNRGNIDVYVDGVKIGTINANSPTLTWQQIYNSPTLSAGTHTVRFVHAGGGTYIDVDAITIIP